MKVLREMYLWTSMKWKSSASASRSWNF